MSSSSSSSSKDKQQREEIDDHHHVGGVHLGGRDYGVINDGGKTSESQTNKEKDKTTFTNDKNDAERNKFSDNAKNKWGQQNEKEEALPKTVQSHHNVGGVHIGGHSCGTITLDGNVYRPSESSQKPDKYGNIGGYNLRGDNNDDIQRDEIDDHHHVGGVHLGGRDYGVIYDGGKTSESQTNKNKRTFSMDEDNAGMNSESSKNNQWHQSEREKEESLPKSWKSHHNVGGVHIGGSNYGTITVSGNKNESSKNSQKPDKYGNVGGYHLRGDNNDDIHYDGSH